MRRPAITMATHVQYDAVTDVRQPIYVGDQDLCDFLAEELWAGRARAEGGLLGWDGTHTLFHDDGTVYHISMVSAE